MERKQQTNIDINIHSTTTSRSIEHAKATGIAGVNTNTISQMINPDSITKFFVGELKNDMNEMNDVSILKIKNCLYPYN